MYVSSVFRYLIEMVVLKSIKVFSLPVILIADPNYFTVYQMCHDTTHNSNVMNEFNYD